MQLSLQEIAAFKDLTTKQKAAYLKAHPKSKFGNNAPKVTQHVKEQRAIKGHLGKAAKSMKLAHAHMALHKDALAKGDSKLADHHEKNMHKHADDADQHYSRAQDTTATHSPKNKARSAKIEKGFDAIKKHSIATKAPKRAVEKDKAANAKKRPFNGFKDVAPVYDDAKRERSRNMHQKQMLKPITNKELEERKAKKAR